MNKPLGPPCICTELSHIAHDSAQMVLVALTHSSTLCSHLTKLSTSCSPSSRPPRPPPGPPLRPPLHPCWFTVYPLHLLSTLPNLSSVRSLFAYCPTCSHQHLNLQRDTEAIQKQHTATLVELQAKPSAETACLQAVISLQPLQKISTIAQDLQRRTELAQLEQNSLDAVKRNADAKLQSLQHQLDAALQHHAADALELLQQQANAQQQQQHDMQLLREQLAGMKRQCLTQLNAMQQQLNAAHQQHERDQVASQQQQDTAQVQADKLQALQGVIDSAEHQHAAVVQQHAAEKRQIMAIFKERKESAAQEHAEHAEEVQMLQRTLAEAKQHCDIATAVQQQQAWQLQSVQKQLDTATAQLAEKRSTLPQQEQQQQLTAAVQQAMHLPPLQVESGVTML